mgnify:FL=1
MIIKSNASPQETSSPFFKANEEFCNHFEHFIANKNGKVKGVFNASSYLIFGEIAHTKLWTLVYKKATFTSTGNLFLSSEHESLLVAAEWKTKYVSREANDFKIRKQIATDGMKLLFNTKLKRVENYPKYIVEYGNELPNLYTKILSSLQCLFSSEELYEVSMQNEELSIELRSDKHHFEVFEKVIEEI